MSCAVEEDPAAVGLHQAHDRIEAGRLARAVGAKQSDDLAAVNVQRHVVKYGAAVVGLGDRAHFKAADRRAAGRRAARRPRLRSSPPVILSAALLRHGEMAGDPAAALFTPGGPPSTTARPVSRSITSRCAVDDVVPASSRTLPTRVISLRSRS